MIANFSLEELLHEVLVAPRGAFVLLPDTRIIERPGFWQIMTPSLRGGGMNEVACTELPDAEADAIIDEMIASYRRLGIRFRWTIGGQVEPAAQSRISWAAEIYISGQVFCCNESRCSDIPRSSPMCLCHRLTNRLVNCLHRRR